MSFVKLKSWTYWEPKPGDVVEGVFTGYRSLTNPQTGVGFDAAGIRGVDGSRWSCTYDRAVKLFKESHVVVGTTVRLTYVGKRPWKKQPAKFFHDFELEIES
jgi:hypothetical protein